MPHARLCRLVHRAQLRAVASPSACQVSHLVSHWCPQPLGLAVPLASTAWKGPVLVEAAVMRNKAPPTQARVSVSPSLKHYYANELATSPAMAFPASLFTPKSR